MSLTAIANPTVESTTYAERLAGLVRGEFRVTVYRPGADNPVLGMKRPLCRVAGCGRIRQSTHGWCEVHLGDWQASGLDADAFAAVADPKPFEPGGAVGQCHAACCSNGAASKGWCATHYQQWSYQGRPVDFASTAEPVAAVPACAVAHCDKPVQSQQTSLCRPHRGDWDKAGCPDMTTFIAQARYRGPKGTYLLSGLRPLLTLELQYTLQRVTDRAHGAVPPTVFNRLAAALRDHAGDIESLLDEPLEHWLAAVADARPATLLRFAYDQLQLVAEDGVDEWAKDRWDLRRLGLHNPQTGREFRFDQISQRWLREAAKRWVRHNLSRNLAVGTVAHHVLAARQFSAYLAEVNAAPDSGAQLTRALLEGFLAWMVRDMPQPRTRNRRISAIKVFIQDCRRFDWAPIPPTACFYLDDFNRVDDAAPRALSEHVMAQLEADHNLALLPDDGTRAAVIVLMRTGIRVGDLIRLPLEPVTYDPAGAPYLSFHMRKLRKDHRIPLDERTTEVIRTQQTKVRRRWPQASPWLFPGLVGNAAGTRHFAYATVANRLNAWVTSCRVLDEHGQPVRVTPHQFRHTLGTRMINDGVAQHVVQRLYGHESAQMTAVYARLTDQTLRTEFDKWCTKRVDIAGQVVLHDPGDEAAWLKERLARAKQTLPNGYCGRPLQQTCPHPNACLTCPDFLTDGQFLPAHRDQLDRTRRLIAAGRSSGNQRLVEMNVQVETNLTRIIDTLEHLDHEDGEQ